MPLEIIQSDTIFTGRAFSIKRYQMRLPDGRSTNFDIVQHPGAVTLVPVDEAGNILFVRQYRLGAEQDLLELPAGTLEPGEDPRLCAAREIREETGMGARELVQLGEFYMAPGYSTEHMYIYLATGLYPDPLPGDEDEFIQVESLAIEEAYRQVEQGQIEDGKTLAALLLARARLLQ
jgi:ADP-ribose pyrophosphatase